MQVFLLDYQRKAWIIKKEVLFKVPEGMGLGEAGN